ncbi:uncharacterized protein ISCGN_023762 [Ixodes scapularis]
MPSPSSTTSSEESEIIAMIEERRFLWDVKDKCYHRRDVKERAYSDIAQAMGTKFTGEAIKSRFSNLRSQFNREHKKVKCSEKSGTGTEDVYVPRWVHYREMLFLQSACPQHGSESNMAPPGAESESPPEDDDSPWGHLEGSEPVDPLSLDLEDEASSQGTSQGTSQRTSQGGTTGSPRGSCNEGTSTRGGDHQSRAPKRKQPEDCMAEKKLLLETAVQTLNKSCAAAAARDECDDFGVSIAHALRHVPQGPHRQMAGLLAYEAVVKYNLNLNTSPEIVQVAPE